MKKIIAILLSTFLIAMTGCGNNSSDNTDNKSSNSELTYIKDYSYYENGAAYLINDEKLYYLDFDTMEIAPLCAVPNCTHNTASCIANCFGRYMPIFYNSYVYFFESNEGAVEETTDGPEFYIDSSLVKVSLDSSEKETVCEFHDLVPRASYYLLYKNMVYFFADDRGVNSDTEGTLNWGNSGGDFYLCSINLDTGEYVKYGQIYEDDKQYEGAKKSRSSNIYGVFDNRIFLSHAYVEDQSLDRTSDDYWSYVNFEFDINTNTWEESELPPTKFIFQDCYLYYDKNDKNVKAIYEDNEYTFELNDLGLTLSEFRSSGASSYNGKIFFKNINKFYDLTDMSEHSMGEYGDYQVIAYYDDCYILVNGGKTAKLTEEEMMNLE